MQVYATLMAAVLLASVGIATDVMYHVGGTLTTLMAFGSLIWLSFTPPTAENQVSLHVISQAAVSRVCVSSQ